MHTAVVVAASAAETRESVTRWAAALGAAAEPADSLAEVRRRWPDAPVVVVDTAMARLLVDVGVPRRPHVLLLDPGLGLGEAADDAWRVAVALGAELVCRPHDEQAQREVMEVLARAQDGRDEACVVAVVGAVGGVGATTLATGIARAAAHRRWRTVVCDLDPIGGLDLVLGAEQAEGARWDTLDLGGGRLPAGALAEVLPSHDGVRFLTGERSAPMSCRDADAVVPVMRRASDLVVLDVPRDPVALAAAARAEVTVVVVPEDVRGIAAGQQMVAHLRGVTGTVVALARGVPGGLGRTSIATHLPVPVVGRLRHRPGLRRDLGLGRGMGSLREVRRAATPVLRLLGLDGAR
ncbi:MAG: hypothetical protein QM597_03920 [Aeromicrobium sp.]|uniref:septum site-determining protein Ssd n=1 Tax=Aeromicrobium sp. TaxID=1871063 RepID=UPI0039E6E621